VLERLVAVGNRAEAPLPLVLEDAVAGPRDAAAEVDEPRAACLRETRLFNVDAGRRAAPEQRRIGVARAEKHARQDPRPLEDDSDRVGLGTPGPDEHDGAAGGE